MKDHPTLRRLARPIAAVLFTGLFATAAMAAPRSFLVVSHRQQASLTWSSATARLVDYRYARARATLPGHVFEIDFVYNRCSTPVISMMSRVGAHRRALSGTAHFSARVDHGARYRGVGDVHGLGGTRRAFIDINLSQGGGNAASRLVGALEKGRALRVRLAAASDPVTLTYPLHGSSAAIVRAHHLCLMHSSSNPFGVAADSIDADPGFNVWFAARY